MNPTPLGATRGALRALVLVACVPYLSLKTAWLAGSRIGIPDGSVLLEHRGVIAAANGLTLLMDACVVVLALLLTQRWGLRFGAWPLAFPMWVATGLLAPVVAGFPAQLAAGFLGGGRGEPFLDGWVFGVVYSGFLVQGLALGALFVLYARDRWGHLWAGGARVGGGTRIVAVTASVLLAGPVAAHLARLAGRLAADPASGRRTGGFPVLESVQVLFAAAAVAGVLTLVLRRDRTAPVRLPLALAWVGSGAVACWGGWLTLTSLLPRDGVAQGATEPMTLAYAGEMIAGALLACCVAAFLRRRAAEPAYEGRGSGAGGTSPAGTGVSRA
ncbi:hypothetical protein [Streptomyces sp. NPDC050856]|uniref:hypothetical protein n=1 Tax=Streptomyces sp. NPDC050856 TaxID=3154939 RepID=UPI0033EB6950